MPSCPLLSCNPKLRKDSSVRFRVPKLKERHVGGVLPKHVNVSSNEPKKVIRFKTRSEKLAALSIDEIN